MHALMTSVVVVALAEVGDKTQLLAILLASRFRKPWPIIGGIFLATIGNHIVAAWAGSAIAGILRGFWFQLAIVVSFFVMAAWILIPDKADTLDTRSGRGPFITTLISFFLVEIGDKTQVATIALGARYETVLWVTLGTTLGMMLANVPAVWFGERVTRVVPVRYIRWISAVIFFSLGAVALIALSRH